MDLIATLKKSFGYDQFRPLQQEIISDALEGRDVFVLMPTGGGKSLCFQLPALLRNGLTIVVSPLISLMKDQVDALQTSGIPATYLNSTLDRDESKARWRGLHRGEYRMLYVAPERLMLETFLERALNWKIAQFAIDEAHCISEWGHDFRPEYRELKKLREHFPYAPVMALTATATERVRTDIVKELKLRDARCYIASFNRPNLTYQVVAKSAPYEQLLAFVRSRPNESGIVYCASRKSTESVARNLIEDGVIARGHHAGLTAAGAKTSEAFLRTTCASHDRVWDGTIHLDAECCVSSCTDLPKIWRAIIRKPAGPRDGLPSEYILLFGAGDVAKQCTSLREKAGQIAFMAQLQPVVSLRRDARMRRDAVKLYEDYPGPHQRA
jgi:ATP-dependent DNA helicase RecQ